MSTRGLRVALYSHDTCGLGHLRRNLLVGRSIIDSGFAENVLLLSGAREVTNYEYPPGLDVVTLPSIRKSKQGGYASRRFQMGIDELVSIRSQILLSATKSFAPDVLIVDNVPRGALGEMTETLRTLRWQSDTRTVLGLRDVLDSPTRIANEWGELDNFATMRELYDEIWIYGDRNIYAADEAYSFPQDLVDRVHYTGYFERAKRQSANRSTRPSYDKARPVVCLVGGGQDGFQLATDFLSAVRHTRDRAIILAGPFMPVDLFHALESQAVGANIEIRRFDSDPITLCRNARRVVTMGGYNTICELLCINVPMLVVPRTSPRKEQLIRAESMARLNVLDFLRPQDASATAIANWIELPSITQRDAREVIRFDAIDSLHHRLSVLSTKLQVA